MTDSETLIRHVVVLGPVQVTSSFAVSAMTLARPALAVVAMAEAATLDCVPPPVALGMVLVEPDPPLVEPDPLPVPGPLPDPDPVAGVW